MDRFEYEKRCLEMVENALHPQKIEVHTCYFCGHIGTDVNGVAHRHIGGQGDVEYPIYSGPKACQERVDKLPVEV